MKIANHNYFRAAVLLETLAQQGVKRVVISPGSRSTPLARTADLSGRFQCDVILDERSAGYFALGCAKAEQRPVILICTSGTAGANYYPAVIEARQSCVPLIILTADRPLSLRGMGALQTIDQLDLFGRFAKFSIDVHELLASEDSAYNLRLLAATAGREALSEPAGPVHLNVPFDEPLVPLEQDAEVCTTVFETAFDKPLPEIEPETEPEIDIEPLMTSIDRSLCGLIVAGPHTARNSDEAEAIHEFARQLGWPVLADAVSGLRFYPDPVFPYFDLFLRAEMLNSLAPDLVIEFGMCPTSKVLNEYLNRHRGVYTVRIQPNALVHDPYERAHETIIANPAQLSIRLSKRVQVSRDSLLFDPFQRASRLLYSKVHAKLNEGEWSETLAAKAAIDSLPDDSNLVLASSLSLRYAEMVAANEGKRLNVFAQRGTNGIEGSIAHGSGIASASDKHTLLLIGDLAFCHDIGSLAVARKQAKNLTIVLFNNNGGGIFHLLPVAEYPDTFEKLHGTPHSLDLSGAAALFDLDWRKASSLAELDASLQGDQRDKLRIIEIASERSASTESLKRFIDELVKAVS
ncbi:2-succinyl-5-enolpyruvyl-6-hydroxy-3-cyclohexene-1-carboxylic-acid synthase [bacterium]|nr:2-succinyl-5-enolpyruvyl-6-hydroxy-3-cyclohexene-1-carboxylic-acid synthase [bacterium]